MSNARRPTIGNTYRTGYLRSPAWFRRRRSWFEEEVRRHGTVRCAVTGKAGTVRTLDLHHLDYAGVRETTAGWVAGERHEDLVAMTRQAHKALHRMLDTDQALSRSLRRREANLQAIIRLRRSLRRLLERWTETA